MTKRTEVQWCTRCGARFTKDEIVQASCCPKCKSVGILCDVSDDVSVYINWHELRILGIWASNYAATFDPSKVQNAEDSKRKLRGILYRLERQFPSKAPLTLGGEIRQLRQVEGINAESINIPLEGVVEVHGPGAVPRREKNDE